MTEHHQNPPEKRIVAHVAADLEDLIPGYLESKREEVDTIRQALSAKDFETIRVLGHGMKGSGGGYGFDAITDIGGAIETAAKEKNHEKIIQSIDQLLFYLDRVQIVVEDE